MAELYYAVPDKASPVPLRIIRRHFKNLKIQWSEESDGEEVVFSFKKARDTIIRFSVNNDSSVFCTLDECIRSPGEVQILADIDNVLKFSGFESAG